MRYIKKPIAIEAFRMTEERRFDNIDWPEWLNAAWNAPELTEGALSIDPDDPERKKLVVGTPSGLVAIAFGDWILRGPGGGIYPCKPDAFEAMYDEAETYKQPNDRFIQGYACAVATLIRLNGGITPN